MDVDRRKIAIAIALAAAGARASAQSSPAEKYPARKIDMLLPYSVGSSGDTALRLLGEEMSTLLGQPLVPENLPAAGGLVGAEKGRRAQPDGYTIVSMADSTLMYLPLLNKSANFNPQTDFEPIVQVADIDWVLVAHPSLPATTVATLVKLANERRGSLDYASGGVASPQQVLMELFKKKLGINLVHIPYKGSAPALIGVVAGDVPVMFSGIAVAAPHIATGKLRAIATTGRQRSALLPTVPTLSESGMPGFTYASWVSLMGPKGMPADRIAVIREAAATALGRPALVQKLRSFGMNPMGNTPAEFRANLASEYVRLSELVKDIGLQRE